MTQSLFVAEEKSRLDLAATIAAGVANMVLERRCWLRFTKGTKLAGAAIAAGMNQFVGGFVPLIYFSRANSSLLQLGRTRLNGRVII